MSAPALAQEAAAQAEPVAQTPAEVTWGEHPLATSGLYPIWEGTGSLLEPATLQLSTSSIAAGLLPRLQIGTQPSYLIHRAPNLEAKVLLLSRPGLSVAWRQAVVALFADAQERMFTPVYASRLSNPSSTVWLVPSSVHATWKPLSFLVIHGSATVLPILSNGEDFGNQAVGGLSTMIELPVIPGNSLLLHAGEVGLWDHDFAYVGASYRLNYRWLLLQLGYAYRIRPDGAQGSPLLNVGLYL